MTARAFAPEAFVELPDTAVFPSIGWVAMHSELDDPDRYSILFKSSPYGSFNHSHGHQKRFIINGRQQSLAIDSGYYDTWKSAHHEGWTMQTKAHNAITYDGGQGQPFQYRSAQGDLLNFARCGDVDMAVGDATPAYKGELSRAVRTERSVPGSTVRPKTRRLSISRSSVGGSSPGTRGTLPVLYPRWARYMESGVFEVRDTPVRTMSAS